MTRPPCPLGCLQKNGRVASHSAARCPKVGKGMLQRDFPTSSESSTDIAVLPATPLTTTESDELGSDPFVGMSEADLAALDLMSSRKYLFVSSI